MGITFPLAVGHCRGFGVVVARFDRCPLPERFPYRFGCCSYRSSHAAARSGHLRVLCVAFSPVSPFRPGVWWWAPHVHGTFRRMVDCLALWLSLCGGALPAL
eukprot:Pompholyxophrys_punicea_v1_NODE_21_length_5692_cov_19.735675.p8 type:complete len:102 gc:universal NODE_21_length_5692_cov_19.735675:1567-1262(-)